MSRAHKRKLKGGILTNLDPLLTEREIEKVEQGERRQEYIEQQIRAAEASESGDAVSNADLIYSGMQRDGVFTADPKKDRDPNLIRRLYQKRMPLPVKQREVQPDGTYAITVSEEATHALAQGLWCANCEESQPDNDIEWGAQMLRLERAIGPRPAGAHHGTHCCYCGNRLGFNGTTTESELDFTSFTPEQRKLFEEMFGPMRAEGA